MRLWSGSFCKKNVQKKYYNFIRLRNFIVFLWIRFFKSLMFSLLPQGMTKYYPSWRQGLEIP